MAVTTSTPPIAQKVTIITSGNGTFTGNGAVQNIANFSADISSGKQIVIELVMTKTLGNNACHIGVSNTSGGAYSTACIGIVSTLADTGVAKISFNKDPNSNNAVYTVYRAVASSATTLNSTLYNSADYEVNTTETFYLVTNNVAAGNNCKYSYLVYLIG